ncbi:MAG: NAD(P)-dependent oxidoreductase [Rhodocyclaceae bacterium]|nr:NAD(P)-dependent oxidoreductase [Rhodocyclaceae bacterium]
MQIGFIGLGAMGAPMVENLLAAGHRVSIWARRPAAAQPLLAKGARWVEGPALLARENDIVCTNVTTGADVERLVADMLAGGKPGLIHVDFSTIAPTLAQRLAARWAECGAHFVDAPVSGGAQGARTASLSIMWGGDGALAERLLPLFRCLGKTLVHVGPVGAGQVAKACNQLVMVAVIQACAEAARLAQAAGVDFARVRAAMLGGSAASRVLERFGEKMASRDFSAGVEARLHHKDFAMILAEAHQRQIPLPLAAVVMAQLDFLMAAGWGKEDTSRLLSVLDRR